MNTEIKQVDASVLEQFDKELKGMIYALNNALPELSTQHQKLNRMLRQFPELTYMLSEDQVCDLMRGVIKESSVQFVVSKPKKVGGKIDMSVLKTPPNLDDILI